MKSIFTLAILSWALVSQSASVLWNEGITFWAGTTPDDGQVRFGIIYNWSDPIHDIGIYNDITMSIDLVGSTERRLARNEIDVGQLVRVITAEVGDEINHETAADDSRLIQTNEGGHPVGSWVEIVYDGNNPLTLYFGIETVPLDADLSGENLNVPRVYGWVEFFVNDYIVTLGNTCFDLTGRPVVVGVRSAEPVPEPATGALAFLGATLLFRRKKT
jgi:hypothetical protein